MDVASSVNIEPPHTLSPVFGPHSSHSQPRMSSPIPSQPPQSPTHPTSPPPPVAEMDLSSSAAAPPPPVEAQDNQDSQMENAESSHVESLPNGHVPFPAASEAFTDGSVHQDGEAMDTTPDHSQESPPANGVPVPPQAANLESATQPGSTLDFTSASAELPDIIPNGDAADAGEPMDTTNNDQTPNSSEPTIPNIPNPGIPQEPASYSSPPPLPLGTDLIAITPGGETVVVGERPPGIPPHPPAPPNDDDTSSSSDDGDREERLERVEDTSVPGEDEMKEIEEAGPEQNALDHDHWQTKFFPDLDDPEYIPGETGRIDWVVTNVNGTWEKPNNETIMRSPPVRVGGFDWNIKYYPKGNGTDQISIYIECSKPKPGAPAAVQGPKENASGNPPVTASAPAPAGITSSESMEVESSDASNAQPTPVPTSNDTSNPPNPPPSTEEAEEGHEDKSWSMAAQFGVVLYSPNEPRVQYNHGNQHRFDPHAPDWGWTRFHGPHNEIHIRQRGQRQALLRNDTLAFTAYVRVVHDETGGLWAYQNNPWDSLEKTGLRGLGSEGPGRAYLVAGLSSWSLLAPFREVIYKSHLPDPVKEPRARPKPLITAMQRLLYRLSAQRHPATSPVTLGTFISAFQWYGLELTTKFDVVEFWEILRRKLDQELKGTEMEGKLGDLFDGLVERQIKDGEDGMVTDTIREPLSVGKAPSFRLPIEGVKSVQEALGKALDGDGKAGKATLLRLPKVMQVELQRQKFDKATRRWTKIVDEMKIDEFVDLKPWAGEQEGVSGYTLYGFIVHNEGLESSLYYPVIRPGGPGTKWFTYLDEKEDSKVICLTRKQAIELHQGVPSGKKAGGTEPVAYILMYVRNDVVGEVLKGIPEVGEPASWIQREIESEGLTGDAKDKQREEQKKDLEQNSLSLQIFHSAMLKSHAGLGVVDPYDVEERTENPDSTSVLYIDISDKLSTIRDLLKEIAEKIGGIEDLRQCRLWSFEASSDSVFRPLYMIQDTPDQLPLKTMRTHWPQMRFWFEVVPLVNLPPLPPPPPPPASIDLPPPQVPSQSADAALSPPAANQDSPAPTTTEGQARSQEAESAAEASTDSQASESSWNTVTPATNIGDPMENAADAMQTDETPAVTQNPAADPEVPPSDRMDAEQSTPEAQTSAEPTAEAASAPTPVPSGVPEPPAWSESAPPPLPPPADTVMGGILDGESSIAPPPPPPPAWEMPPLPVPVGNAVMPTPSLLPPLLMTSIYFFLKRFDVEKQMLIGLGGYYAKLTDKVDNVVRKCLELPQDKKFLLWEEVSLNHVKPLNLGRSFDHEKLFNGTIMIIQDSISEKETAAIEGNGDFSTVPSYIKFLLDRVNRPETLAGFVTRSYFSGEQFSGHCKNGRKHGPGTFTYTNGDTYEGHFVADYRQGKGTMTFQNRDTYTGDWKNDVMDGEGKFVFHKTGNVYTGGFRAGRRHGRGTMEYLVADEEQNLCQICYEGEMDSLFYDCGHVCACVECAKQLENCPVCRKAIVSVVKIYRTL
ncbi:hypothetical protein FGG08_002994 [Glutinoglossum americanum]|uniref:Uncharacterized protein n=1 Tax=Glutinoglossum americanum TaxID=1670608 RepID=A0A9P8L3Z5_9PEZI|nr:hypothetical protein FGG08_002994 [Glutinoglossum americanum]